MGTPIEEKEGAPQRYRWVVLGVSIFAFVAYAFAFQQAPPLLSAIRAEFSIPHAEAGLVMSMVVLPGIFLSLPAGFLAERMGIRPVGCLSLVCVAVGCLGTATASSVAMLLLGRFIVGVGGAFILSSTPAIIAQWFPRQELGKSMGIYGISMPFATVVALPSASVLLLTTGWRVSFYLCAGIGLVAALLFFGTIRAGPFLWREGKANLREAVGNLEIWKVGLVWLFFNGAALSFITWSPELFETFRHISPVNASLLASVLMWGAILCVPFFGWLSDRVGQRRIFIVSGSLFMVLSFMAVAYTFNLALVLAIITLGVSASMVPPIVSAVPAETLKPALASIGFGITGLCSNLGATLAQPFIGWVLDTTYSYTFAMLGLAVLSALGAVTAFTLKTK